MTDSSDLPVVTGPTLRPPMTADLSSAELRSSVRLGIAVLVPEILSGQDAQDGGEVQSSVAEVAERSGTAVSSATNTAWFPG